MLVNRCCISCRKRLEKQNLHRIVSKDGLAILDEKQNINSRGVYICKDSLCITRLIKNLNKDKASVNITLDKDSFIKLLEELK